MTTRRSFLALLGILPAAPLLSRVFLVRDALPTATEVIIREQGLHTFGPGPRYYFINAPDGTDLHKLFSGPCRGLPRRGGVPVDTWYNA